MSSMTQPKRTKKHGKRQAAASSQSNAPANQDVKLPEVIKASIQDLQKSTVELQAVVESLGESISEMECISAHQLSPLAKRKESTPKNESSDWFDWFLREEAATSELGSFQYTSGDLPSPRFAAQVILEGGDENYIELFRRLYGSSPRSVLESDI
ncbi:hypothetical protein P3T76_002281 [Phytophthora citrophthora]|uniref:Uncharacterized protein n=1 Tax=Phytophthora citrophthora TaxID=4793 RepID=A0AAD9GY40_9STRA|nr:hypothetical protein P3T76_002277 [Phytophthora citrophthora]KAK1946729.1 hypothetical protein P3T76_002281 [Phytophthora citrophthora]